MSIASQYVRGRGKKRAYGSGINTTLYADYPLPAPVFTTLVNVRVDSAVTRNITSVLSITVA